MKKTLALGMAAAMTAHPARRLRRVRQLRRLYDREHCRFYRGHLYG